MRRLERRGLVDVGQHTYGEPRILHYAFDPTRLVIGSYTSIAKDVTFVLGGNHRVEAVSTFPLRIRLELPGAGQDGQPWSKGDIHVGSDVWLGVGAMVLSGVSIGDGAVVAAGSVVTTDVRPYAVVAGVPARELRRRFDDAICEQLREIAWWNWPEDLVVDRVADLTSDQVAGFVERWRTRST